MAGSDQIFCLAIQRFGLGAQPGSRAAFGASIRDALIAEIAPEKALLRDPALPSTAGAIQIVAQVQVRQREMRANRRQMAQAGAGSMMGMEGSEAGKMKDAARPQREPNPIREVLLAEVEARLKRGATTELGFAERWVAFWSNHFCIALRRGQIMQGVAGAYEREVIRAHAFGRFSDLLVAAETHPAMLHYLDQRQSIGPNSPAGRRRSKGLNENLAREIMELHTLGVGGGYSQGDVTSFANALTGWSISNQEEMLDGYGGFFFAPNRHEPGPQKVLGKLYADRGKAQGVAILEDLARHPATARFVATKLARHFVADDPPKALVARLEKEFLVTKGDLAALARSLLTAPEAFASGPMKLRTPCEFLLASLRATGTPVERVPRFMNALNLMGQPLWNPPGPNGHADDEATLASPKAIKTRLEFALQIARPLGGKLDPRTHALELYGAALLPETQRAIARAETRPQGLALLLMSPDFQRR